METFFFQDDAWRQRALPLMLEVVRSEFYGLESDSNHRSSANEPLHRSTPTVPICPHCGSSCTVKRGFAGEAQRYLCKSCGKTFSARSQGAFAHSHVTWTQCSKFVQMMMWGATVRSCSEELGLSVSTCHALRHRVCVCLANNQMPLHPKRPYTDRADVTYIRESFSGNHAGSSLPRPAHRRGRDQVKRGISDEQICLLTVLGEGGCIIVRALCHGRPTGTELRASFEELINEGALSISDPRGKQSLISVLERSCMQYLSGEVNDRLSSNAFSDLYKSLHAFLGQFKGVSTTNLPDYLAWFQWISNVRTEDMQVRYQRMLSASQLRG